MEGGGSNRRRQNKGTEKEREGREEGKEGREKCKRKVKTGK